MSQPPMPPMNPPPRRGSWLAAGIMVAFLILVLGLLALIALRFVLVVVALLAFVGVNYLIWGAWLGNVLRRESEEEENRG